MGYYPKNCEPHAVAQARRRFGLVLGPKDLDIIARQIVVGKAPIVVAAEWKRDRIAKGQTCHNSYLVMIAGVHVVAVYDMTTRRVVTLVQANWRMINRHGADLKAAISRAGL